MAIKCNKSACQKIELWTQSSQPCVLRSMGSCYGTITVATLVIQDCFVGLLFALMPLFKQATVSVSSLASLVPPVVTEIAPTPASGTNKFGSWGRLRRMTASEDLSFVAQAAQGGWDPDRPSDGVGVIIARWLQETAESPINGAALDLMHSSPEPQQGLTALVAVARVVLKITVLGAASLLLARTVLSYPLKLLAR